MESAERLQAEAGQSLSKYDVADNVDLVSIVHQWEDYHTFKFGKPPKIIRRISGISGDTKESSATTLGILNRKSRKKKAVIEIKQPEIDVQDEIITTDTWGKVVHGTTSTALKGKLSSLHSVQPNGLESSGTPPAPAASSSDGSKNFGATNDISLSGNKMRLKAADEKDAAKGSENLEKRLLKPLPTFGGDPDTRALASVITRDIYQHSPGVYWNDIVELEKAKKIIERGCCNAHQISRIIHRPPCPMERRTVVRATRDRQDHVG